MGINRVVDADTYAAKSDRQQGKQDLTSGYSSSRRAKKMVVVVTGVGDVVFVTGKHRILGCWVSSFVDVAWTMYGPFFPSFADGLEN